MFQFLLKSHFLSAVVLPVASLLPPFHSPPWWKGNSSSFPFFFPQMNVCTHATHSSAFPSAHPGQISLLSLKMYLAAWRSLKIPVQSLLLAGFPVHFTSVRAVSAGTVTVQTSPPHLHHFHLLSFPLSHQTVPCSFSLSSFQNSNTTSKIQTRIKWTGKGK